MTGERTHTAVKERMVPDLMFLSERRGGGEGEGGAATPVKKIMGEA